MRPASNAEGRETKINLVDLPAPIAIGRLFQNHIAICTIVPGVQVYCSTSYMIRLYVLG